MLTSKHQFQKKYWTICGPEFAPELQGCKAKIVRALYGTKCAGKDFRNHLRSWMDLLNYKSCLANPDLWMRAARNSIGKDYYEYVLLYTDDALVVSENPKECLLEIDKYFPMKKCSIDTPRLYLGGKISQVQLPNGVITYALSMSQYVQEAIKNIERTIK